jgi:hypothetical protein
MPRLTLVRRNYASCTGTDVRTQGYPKAHNEPHGMRTSMFKDSERDDTKRTMMKNKLLATVAMTALIGCTSFAIAQNAGTQGGAMQSQGAQQHQMGNPSAAGSPGSGAVSAPSGGNAQNEPSTSAPQGSSPEGKGFSQEEHNKSATPQRGAQGNGQQQRGAPGSTQEQRGAQNQPGTQQRGAQDNDRAGANGNQDRMGQQNGAAGRASGGANVELTQDQRTKIKDVVVRDRNVARVDNVNFNIRVGVAVPRTVHVAVLPAEVVTLVPEYRGFEYVVVGDQLLIIDPNTMEIVAILPA